MTGTKPFIIEKKLVFHAYQLVKRNGGAAGVDKESIKDFEQDLKSNLYKIWNRMSSGSYFPPPVKAVNIPKKLGGTRVLGVPTVSDRVAQMVVKLTFEPSVEPFFLPDSYGYRPNKSALDAVGVTRHRCWNQDWVLEFDIKGLFDNIPHDLLMKAVRKHTSNSWVLLYIERWLTAPMSDARKGLVKRTMGTPQGGVISPLLANLFLHYTFDKWITKYHPSIKWCRYADDGLLHCRSEIQAKELLDLLQERFESCGLTLHPEKTKIIYCKDSNRSGDYHQTTFDFLGYTFRPRVSKNSNTGELFMSFSPAVSKVSMKSMKSKLRDLKVKYRSDKTLVQIAGWLNPYIRGWFRYYGRYCESAMFPLARHINQTLVRWAMWKHKTLKNRKTRAAKHMEDVAKQNPRLFVHWGRKMRSGFA